MLTIQLLFIFVIIYSVIARPNDFQPIEKASDNNKDGVTYTATNDFTSSFSSNIQPIQPIHSSDLSKNYTTKTNSEQLVRKKRFLFGNWRECGRTPWGATLYTNGIGNACIGNCPCTTFCGNEYNEYYVFCGGRG